eukprot:TRINITY_DN26746_c0_g1_i1.p1 TRINITY_DN26746_c0_g1~~TRINITY_DN26746_c0_g1_i1.p1  ORF type:complete len:254 (-),score=47.60 TRINITY_DN26746_c0_g1_i1:256-975(-)
MAWRQASPPSRRGGSGSIVVGVSLAALCGASWLASEAFSALRPSASSGHAHLGEGEASELVSLPLLRRSQRHLSVSRFALAPPPTRTRPPDTEVDVSAKASEWTECLINDPSHPDSLHVETWVFRSQDYGDFERLLKLRGFKNEGSQGELTCRERAIDAEIRCAECVRLLRGGYYGSLGVAVPAYPPQSGAVGCLALSKLIDMPPPDTEQDDSGDWDGDEGRQTAMCNSVNARFDKVDA